MKYVPTYVLNLESQAQIRSHHIVLRYTFVHNKNSYPLSKSWETE